MILAFGIFFWLSFGVLAYGSFIAHASAIGVQMHGSKKQAIGFAMLLMGPIAFLAQLFSTDFFSYGFKFQSKQRGSGHGETRRD